MAITISARIVTFIQQDWVSSPIQNPGTYAEFKGDNRGFDKDSTAYRTAQQVNVNFTNTGGTYTHYKNTGITTLRVTSVYWPYPSETQSAQADPSGITETVLAQQLTGSDSDYIVFQLKGHEANPLIELAPSSDYVLVVTIYKNGLITVSGDHDGFPAYEIYGSVNGGTWQNLYLYDPATAGKTVNDLFDPLDVHMGVQRDIIV